MSDGVPTEPLDLDLLRQAALARARYALTFDRGDADRYIFLAC